jgi:hypothetical protein
LPARTMEEPPPLPKVFSSRHHQLNDTKRPERMQLTCSLRSTLGLAAIVSFIVWRSPHLAAAPLNQELQAYVATPEHQTETVKAAQSSGRWQISGCSRAQPFGPSQITYASSSMSFAPNGTPLSGMWMERVIASGCGRDVLLNVAWIISNGRISDGSMAPGATRADPLLQTDAARIVVPIAQAKVPPCVGSHSFIYDTVVDPAASGAMPGGWTERWTIASCNKYVTVPISFTPDGKGGTNLAVRGGATITD